jgi:hypothetical protein
LPEQDAEELARRFPPLRAASVRRVATVFNQGFTPVDLVVGQLVQEGLPPLAAAELIRELRELRSRPKHFMA